MKFLVVFILFTKFSYAQGNGDGLNTTVDNETHQELLAWANNAENELNHIPQQIDRINSPREQLRLLRSRIHQLVLNRSAHGRQQLLMRYALNRTRDLALLIKQHEPSTSPLAINLQLSVYRRGIALARRYSQEDQIALAQENLIQLPYALFGVDFANEMILLARRIENARAQFYFLAKTLQFLKVDLAQDSRAQNYAHDYRVLHTILSSLNTIGDRDDSSFLELSRQIKASIESLHIHDGNGLLDIAYFEMLVRFYHYQENSEQINHTRTGIEEDQTSSVVLENYPPRGQFQSRGQLENFIDHIRRYSFHSVNSLSESLKNVVLRDKIVRSSELHCSRDFKLYLFQEDMDSPLRVSSFRSRQECEGPLVNYDSHRGLLCINSDNQAEFQIYDIRAHAFVTAQAPYWRYQGLEECIQHGINSSFDPYYLQYTDRQLQLTYSLTTSHHSVGAALSLMNARSFSQYSRNGHLCSFIRNSIATLTFIQDESGNVVTTPQFSRSPIGSCERELASARYDVH